MGLMDATLARSYPFGPVVGLEIDPMYAWLRGNEPLQLRVAPAALPDRFPDLRLAVPGDPLERKAGTAARGPLALEVAR